MRLPTVFISHGAPDLVLHNSPAREFLAGFGVQLGKPRAIVIASAHFASHRPAVVGDAQPGMIYDFGGFDPKLNTLVYPAPGDPVVAVKVAGLLQATGLAPTMVEKRGYDHGAWVPLMLMYPLADVPVVQLSVQPQLGAAHHFALGRALASLADENILVVGSGSATHNLSEFFRGGYAEDAPAPDWVVRFDDWVHEKAEAGAAEDLIDYRSRAPFARENHPTEEHFVPLHVALGAAGEGARGERVHTSHQHGVLMMDAYTFH
ncbi:MAG TPA: class III extradiol ring-cleavage dioxygenase [Xanthobacteraceae bacterium]|nr:class III extradiol ring-cleavage dioxygenase [Xanthobacteraceae bacterium]